MAAIKQLQIVGEKIGIPVYAETEKQNPVKIAKNGLAYAIKNGHDMVFIDTAGRLQIDEAMMEELVEIKNEVEPIEILLTIDAMAGQDAVNVAKSFNETVGIDGVILTKLDGDTRGGAALSVRAVTGKPIKFAGMGEKLGDIEPHFTRRNYENIATKSQVLIAMLNNPWIHPEVAYASCGMFPDPESAYLQGKAWKEEQEKKAEQKLKEAERIADSGTGSVPGMQQETDGHERTGTD